MIPDSERELWESHTHIWCKRYLITDNTELFCFNILLCLKCPISETTCEDPKRFIIICHVLQYSVNCNRTSLHALKQWGHCSATVIFRHFVHLRAVDFKLAITGLHSIFSMLLEPLSLFYLRTRSSVKSTKTEWTKRAVTAPCSSCYFCCKSLFNQNYSS